MKNQLFFYPEVKSNGRRATIAGIIDDSNNQLRIGIAECSPKDQFTKKKGRMIAAGRAASKHALQVVELSEHPTVQFVEIAKSL